MASEIKKNFKIPLGLSGKSEISHLTRELDKLEQYFMSAEIRKAGNSVHPPRITRMLGGIAQDNQLNLLQQTDRKYLLSELKALEQRAPNVHITFAAEPPPRVLETIVAWLRNNINPETLVIVGLQPSLAAGIVLRTNNRIFDMSLRSHLKNQEPFLVKLIDGVVRG